MQNFSLGGTDMRVITADPIGLCFGVRRAISVLEQELQKNSRVYSLGSPIHNPQEIARLEKLGLVVVDKIDDIPEGSVAFVRTHGATPLVFEQLEKKCSSVIDGTCPFVKTAQERAQSLSEENYTVVISGDKNHPEVQAIMGCVKGSSAVVSGASEIPETLRGKRCGIMSQTTQKVTVFSELVSAFVDMSPEIKVYNTICKATLARQESLKRLTSDVDGIIVLGGHDSANTRNLVRIAEDASVPVLWIEYAEQLERKWFEGKESIGIAAGCSTPDWLIKQLIEKLQKM